MAPNEAKQNVRHGGISVSADSANVIVTRHAAVAGYRPTDRTTDWLTDSVTAADCKYVANSERVTEETE